jgi:mRNA interferase MazF
MQTIKRGEVWWVLFESAVGGEIRKTRPAVVISNNAANAVLNRVVVVPLSSRTDKLYPGEARVQVEGRESKAMADQIATASKKRLSNRLGMLSPKDVKAVEDAILVQLGIRR